MNIELTESERLHLAVAALTATHNHLKKGEQVPISLQAAFDKLMAAQPK